MYESNGSHCGSNPDKVVRVMEEIDSHDSSQSRMAGLIDKVSFIEVGEDEQVRFLDHFIRKDADSLI